MEKTDYRKIYRQLYNPGQREPATLTVPELQFLMIDGVDARPESTAFQTAIEALFSVAYTLKFAFKKLKQTDFAVMPLEGLWWADNPDDFVDGRKENWKWTLMILQPDFVQESDVQAAVAAAGAKKSLPALKGLRLEKFAEGPSVQILYIGPFSGEHAAILRLHAAIAAQNGRLSGKHHEIYLSDFRKTAPEKLKTILRQAFVPAQ